MQRKLATRAEIEAMLVNRVSRHPKLKRIELIAVIGPMDRPSCNWDVATFPNHNDNPFLMGIVQRIQLGYTLKQ